MVVRTDGIQGMVEMNQYAPYVLPLGFHRIELLTKKPFIKGGWFERMYGTQGMVDMNQEAPIFYLLALLVSMGVCC